MSENKCKCQAFQLIQYIKDLQIGMDKLKERVDQLEDKMADESETLSDLSDEEPFVPVKRTKLMDFTESPFFTRKH